MGEELHKHVLENFTWEETASKIIDIMKFK